LKLHIEVLQEKIDDLEKDKDKFKLKLQEERRSIEIKVRDEYAKQVEQKQLELDKVTKELNKHKEFINAMERNRGKVLSSDSNHTASQVKVVRVNNFIGTT
jgi:predicted RNase H-like nuclease (RuvC/YqgF family)